MFNTKTCLFTDAPTIARVVGVTKPTPLNWFKSGKLPGVKIGGTILFHIDDVARILGIPKSALVPTGKEQP